MNPRDKVMRALAHRPGPVPVDVAAPMPGGTMFGYANENWKEWQTPWGPDGLDVGRHRNT